MVWISVVLVIAVGLFFMRDNIAKFINNAAIQIAGEESDGRNEYGFYFGKVYWCESQGMGFVYNEDGSYYAVNENGDKMGNGAGYLTYDNGSFTEHSFGDEYTYNFSPDGKSVSLPIGTFELKE